MKQYDSGESITNDFFARVAGTMNGTININGKDVTIVDANTIGHTFTVRGL
jgi:predicted secreted protein